MGKRGLGLRGTGQHGAPVARASRPGAGSGLDPSGEEKRESGGVRLKMIMDMLMVVMVKDDDDR